MWSSLLSFGAQERQLPCIVRRALLRLDGSRAKSSECDAVEAGTSRRIVLEAQPPRSTPHRLDALDSRVHLMLPRHQVEASARAPWRRGVAVARAAKRRTPVLVNTNIAQPQ